MSGSFVFNGMSSLDYGLRVGGVSSYAAPGREVETYYVPGRIGAVYPAVDYTQIPNEIREYSAALYMRNRINSYVENMMTLLRQDLLDVKGYGILTDSYEPSFYRRAFFTGDFVPTRKGAGQNFEIPLRFSCDPRRFIAGNHNFVVYGGSGTVTHDTPDIVGGFIIETPAKPLIGIDSGGDEVTITFEEADTGIQIGQLKLISYGESVNFTFDAETLMAYYADGSSANSLVEDVIGEIRLGPGSTRISFNSSTIALTFTPRWWVR